MSVGVPRIPPPLVEAVAKEAKRERRGDAWRPRIAAALTAASTIVAVTTLCVGRPSDEAMAVGLFALFVSVLASVGTFVTTWQASRVRGVRTGEVFAVSLCGLWVGMGVATTLTYAILRAVGDG